MMAMPDKNKLRKYGGNVNVNVNGNVVTNDNNNGVMDEAIWEQAKRLWNRYCATSTVHGLKYISDREMNWCERFIWIVLVAGAALGIVYVSLLIQLRFLANQKATVVESTIYAIYEIPYPAVTFCNYNKINALRIESAINHYMPKNRANETLRSKLNAFIHELNRFELNWFYEMSLIMEDPDYASPEFDRIDVAELYVKVAIGCPELFPNTSSCWWRNQFYNCCDIFFEQKTEFGLCWSFNSATNTEGKLRVATDDDYPWRTSNSGDWSGLRVEFKIDTRLSITTADSCKWVGLQILINDPFQWPSLANFITTGTLTPVTIKPTYSYAHMDVSRLEPELRECVYPNEISAAGSKYHTLPGTVYTYSNCLSQCRNLFIMRTCKCILHIFYPVAIDNEMRMCRIRDFKCVTSVTEYINFFKPPPHNRYFDSNQPGMNCSCLPECNRVTYEVGLYPNRDQTGIYNDSINVDIHFQQGTMIKYRTEISFNWMDLLVAFGGIAGLFLGISILSLAEIAFFFLMGLASVFHQWKGLIQQSNARRRIKINSKQLLNRQKY